ncbi:MAG: FecR domain-containing protein [Proteobacteria bacterium]|nr:FecR domain-containing protein [Pseudomonadota bacterium]
MMSKEEQVRASIAEQAADWIVANEDGLDVRQSAALAAWLKASPLHVEEFLRGSAVARDLRLARSAPEYAVEAVLAGARDDEDAPVHSLWARFAAGSTGTTQRWVAAAASIAAIAVLSFGLVSLRSGHPGRPEPSAGIPTLHFETGHGEQLNRRLADNSVVHLNTDSSVTIRFSATERLVMLSSGQAEFKVAHDPARAFRVVGGPAEVIAIGTQFDVRLKADATVVTVLEGRVSVGLSQPLDRGAERGFASPRYVQVGANEQVQVTEAAGPSVPAKVDAQNETAWLHREIVFDHEPLEQVVAEFNRYAKKPVVILTPSLGRLEISGAFATDDADAFVAFLRTLKGLKVQTTPTRIEVSQR